MVYIPGVLANKVYEQGSLKNTDDGFVFAFKNRITPLKISGMRNISVEIDGKPYPLEKLSAELGGKNIDLSGESLNQPYSFAKDAKLLIKVDGDKLSDGKHTIKISFITNEYGGASVKVSDSMGKTDFPLLRFIVELIGRMNGTRDNDTPLRIQGDFPVLNSIIEKIEEITGTGHERKKQPLRITGELGGVPLDPDFSRLEAALRREEADRVPFFEPDIAVPIQEWFLGREMNTAADDVEFYIRAGYDCVPVVAPFFAPRLMRHASGGGPKLNNDDQERAWITESEGIIKTVKDVENFPWPKAEEINLSSFNEIAELLPPKMKILGCLVPGTIFGNASQAMGLENFSYALYDNPKVVEALFEVIGQTFHKIVKRVVKMPKLGAVLLADDLAHAAGTLVSPKVYRKFVFPWYKKIGEVLDGAGIPFIHHSDGTTINVLDDLADCGIIAIHPIEPLAMDIVEVKKKYGDRFCIFGNIDLEYTLTRGTVEDVENLVKKRIKELGPGGGWGLSASNSVPDYVKPENYRAMIEAGKKYGKYPISL